MRIHIVQPEETWAAIAERYGTTPEEIRAYNGVAEEDLHPGMKLKVPPVRSAAEARDLQSAEADFVREHAEAGGDPPASEGDASSLSEADAPDVRASSAAFAEAEAAAEQEAQEGKAAANAWPYAASTYVPVGAGTGFFGFAPSPGGWGAPGLWCVPAYFPGFWPQAVGGGAGVWPPTAWPTPAGYVPGSSAVGVAFPPPVGISPWGSAEVGARAFWEGIARTSLPAFSAPSVDEAVEPGKDGAVAGKDEAFPEMFWGGDVEEA
ncbi:LysM peptidoglycan-binding domain-containing protein [Brockia lithotrophica]|uniref:LysM domain-containing protein n=1 Tax=Brockia lithotrophica TaxID=933949 RepID=A0A660L559_9BACL|nr:LysM peptidoglycan-binding domain-containing protein [Brockia lithotrophica]RKQ89067.1 LysM domain-containing protein [Brockia lithotrophica]